MNNPLLILIVDDESSFREIFSLALSKEGYKIETAVDGEDGGMRLNNLPRILPAEKTLERVEPLGAIRSGKTIKHVLEQSAHFAELQPSVITHDSQLPSFPRLYR